MSFKAVLQDACELHLLSHLDNTMQHQLWHVPAACLLRSWCFKQMQETIEIFFSPKLGIKEQQSLAKIPDTLVCAMEFITLPTSATQEAAFATLRSATLRLHPELKVGARGPTLGRCAAVPWWGLTELGRTQPLPRCRRPPLGCSLGSRLVQSLVVCLSWTAHLSAHQHRSRGSLCHAVLVTLQLLLLTSSSFLCSLVCLRWAALKRQPGDPRRALSQGSHHMSTTDH